MTVLGWTIILVLAIFLLLNGTIMILAPGYWKRLPPLLRAPIYSKYGTFRMSHFQVRAYGLMILVGLAVLSRMVKIGKVFLD